MSAQPLLHGLTNGFMFGMLTSLPSYGGYCTNPFYNPCFNPISLFMPCGSVSTSYPLMPQIQMPVWDFAPIQFNFDTTSANNNTGFDFSHLKFNFTPVETENTSTNSGTASTESSSSGADKKYASYSGSNTDVTKRYTGSVDALNRQLANRGVLRGKGAKFMEMQEKYGISASFLAAICINESGGTSAQATDSRNLHNVAGITASGGKGWKKYASVDDCIEDLARLLKNNYVNKGLTTISQIHQKYCPPKGDPKDTKGMNSGWGSSVSRIKDGIDSASA